MATFKIRDKETGEVFTIREKEEKKKAWEISTPEELVGKGFGPTAAGLLATGQQLSSPAWKYGSMLAGGLPDVALEKMGYEAPTSQIQAATPWGTKDITGLTDTAANIAGFVGGAPMRAGAALAKAIPGAGVGAAALRGATQYGTAMGLHTPRGAFDDWKQRGMRAAGGAAGGAVVGTVQGLTENFINILKEPQLLKTGKDIRGGFFGFKTKLSNWFGGKISKFQASNPGKTVDLTGTLSKFQEELGDSKRFKALLRGSPRLQKALEGGKLPLKETQDLINQLKETLSENMLSGLKVRPSQGEVMKLINSLQKAKHTAFPQMKATDATYGKMSEYTNAVENYMTFPKTAHGLRSMFNNKGMRKSLRTILPKELFDRASQTVMAQKFGHMGARVLDTVVRYGIIYKFMMDMVDKINITGGGAEGEQYQ